MLYNKKMKSNYKNSRIRLLFLIIMAICIFFERSANAQTTPEINMESDPQYQETQKFLSKTKNLIERTKAETDARAKEIEALTNRVGELIANMGSTSEDAYNLRSELSVQSDLLAIERETTEGLRRQMLILNKNLEAQKTSKSEIEAKLRSVIISLRAENKKVKKSLYDSIDKSENNSNTEVNLRSEIKSLRLKQAETLKILEARLQSRIVSLRAENKTANKRILALENQKKSSATIETKLRAKLASLRTEHAKALKRLNQGLERASNQTNINRSIMSDLKAAKTLVEQLQKEIQTLKGNHNVPKTKKAQ